MHYALKYSLLASLIVSASVQAEEEFRQHEAHVHGHVEFNIAQDGKELLVEITAPGSDVVGFEHPPENESQHDLIENTEKVLKTPTAVLLLSSSAECTAEHVDVQNSLEKHHELDHDEDTHKEHDHEQHDHKSEKKIGDHGSFTIEYHFDCNNITKLDQIGTKWFELFPNTKEISVNILTDTRQNALELTKENHIIKL